MKSSTKRIKLDNVSCDGTRCRLLEDYECLLRAAFGTPTPETRQLQSQIEETLCGQATALAHAEASLRETEAQLRHAQKMEAIGSLAGGVAHDFNNILSVILGASDLLLAGMSPGDPIREDLEMIREAGGRGAALTHQLLLFSRKQMTEPKVLDTRALLNDIEKMLRRVLGEDIALVCNVQTPPPRVKADPGLLEQVLMNLAVNARDAMPYGGQLDIEVSSIAQAPLLASDAPAGSLVVFTITDTGCGMDSATRARVFEPFFTTKEPGCGTGLGLSTVFGIIKQSGGSISLSSELGKGTRFVIYLPSVQVTSEERPPQPAPRSACGNETILLVEDDHAVKTVASDMLRRYGYKVVETSNAGEALLVCEKHPSQIHLLLTDVVMPRMSGPELARRLAAVRPDMRVLFTSGHTNDAIVARDASSLRIPCLQKPLTVAGLTQKVREVLDAPQASRLAPSAA